MTTATAAGPPGHHLARHPVADAQGQRLLGLFGADARDVYRARTGGVHHVTVFSADGTATGYVLRVHPA